MSEDDKNIPLVAQVNIPNGFLGGTMLTNLECCSRVQHKVSRKLPECLNVCSTSLGNFQEKFSRGSVMVSNTNKWEPPGNVP